MRIKDYPDAKVYYPDDDKERRTIEGLVEKGLVVYIHGGYSLTEKGVGVSAELEARKKRKKQCGNHPTKRL